MKKSIFHVAVLGLLTSIAAISCDDNTDVCQEHILTQDEINEMARQDSIKEVQKNQINADLILEYQAIQVLEVLCPWHARIPREVQTLLPESLGCPVRRALACG